MRANTMRFVFTLGAVLVFGVLLAAPAAASGGQDELTDNDQIVMNGRLDVPTGDTVDTAVLFHGTATIAGTVTNSVVVFDGPTDISGHVQQDVFVFSGPVTVRSGAQIDGDLVTSEAATVEPGATIGGEQQRISARFDAQAFGVASRIAWWIGYTVSALLLGVLLLWLAPGLDAAIVRAVRERMGGSIGFGALAFFALPIIAVLLLVTVVALPLGLFAMLAFGLIYTVGYVAGAHAIGRLLVKPPTSRFLAFLAGLGLLRVLALIPVLGGLTWTLASIFGLGVLLVASRRAADEPAPAQALPPAPAPTA
jgi:hypothetical protein